MREWGVELNSLLGELGKNIKGAARAVQSVFDDDPYEVLAYRGYGDGRRAHVYGRVVEKVGVGVSTDADSTLRNLINTYRRADSDPLAHAGVVVEYAGGKTQMKADDEGYFGGWLDSGEAANGGAANGGSLFSKKDEEWHEYTVELVSRAPLDTDSIKGTGEILVPAAGARFGVISDLDDTVIQSRVSNFLQAARTVMLGNARTRLPFPGVAAFYEALKSGAEGDEKNPIFYVSSSPWNIYDVIAEFIDLQKIPRGPILLRDWDIGLGSLSAARHFDHKGVAIHNIMKFYSDMQFILIGDTSQHDPEIYRQIVGEFPDRVMAIYIRDVVRSAERSASVKKLADEVLAAHSTLVLCEDTLGAAKHAAGQGWINADALPHVSEEKRADEGKDDSKVATPEGGKPTSGDAPVVIG